MRAARTILACAAAAWLAACSLAPAYQAPPAPVPARYQDLGPWVAAQPADGIPRGSWWALYGDAGLSALEARLQAGNPDLAAALAHYDQARAYDAAARSSLFPLVSGMVDASRNRQSATRPLRSRGQPDEYGSYTLGVQADYELDLWGKVRNQVAAVHAETVAAQADLAAARLSLEVRLADDYVLLRGLDREIKLLQDTVVGYGRSLQLTQTLHDGGIVSGLDVSRAQTQLASARAQVAESSAQRALLEHAIAALVGEPAPGFSLPAATGALPLPAIPVGLPSVLLQRRPDIAAAERRTAAANAAVGVARAAFYPNIDLSATLGLQSISTSSWLQAPASYWALGPNVMQYIFDAGLREARLAQARAALAEAGDQYRAVALAAFQEVADDLSRLHDYSTEYVDQGAAVDAAGRSLELSLEQYRDGAVDYLNVVDSQVVALAAQRALLQLETRRLRASVDLVRALGGGWGADELQAMNAAAAPAGRR